MPDLPVSHHTLSKLGQCRPNDEAATLCLRQIREGRRGHWSVASVKCAVRLFRGKWYTVTVRSQLNSH